MSKKKEGNFLFGFQLANWFSFASNIINDYLYNCYFSFGILKIIFSPYFISNYKLFMLFNKVNYIVKTINTENNKLKKKSSLYSKKKIRKNSMSNFSNFIQNSIFSGTVGNNLIMNFFFEFEFILEKRAEIHFGNQLFYLLFWIMFVNISLINDQTIIEHSLSFTKSFNDFKLDINGLNKFKLDFSYSEQYFTDIFSYLYESNILMIFQKNINYLFSKKIKVSSFIKNYKQVFCLSTVRIKIKTKKNNFQELFLDLKHEKNIFRKKNLENTKNCHFKINQSIFLNLINTFIDKFRIDFGFLVSNIVEIYWFQFSLKKTHIINHVINRLFINLLLYKTNKKKASFFFFNQIWLTNNCNSLFCYKVWIKLIIKHIIGLNVKIENFILKWLYLFEKNPNFEIIIKDFIKTNSCDSKAFFFFEIFEKKIKSNNFQIFNRSILVKLLNLKKNSIEFFKNIFFFEKLFRISNFRGKNYFIEIDFFLQEKCFFFKKVNYLIFIFFSIILANKSFYRQLSMIQYYQEIMQDIIMTKAFQFYYIKIFSLMKFYNYQINYSVFFKKNNFLYELDINNLIRIIIVKKTIPIFEITNFSKKYKNFSNMFNKTKITIKNDKKRILKLLRQNYFKKKTFIKLFNKMKQIEKLFRHKNYETECSLLEFFELFLNVFSKNCNIFYFLYVDNRQNYSKWKIFSFLSDRFKKKSNVYKIKWQKKFITNKISFVFEKGFFQKLF
nr:hypothetical protein CcurKRNrm3_p101 [Cryptomonas curvata]